MAALPRYSPADFRVVDEDTYRVRFTGYDEPQVSTQYGGMYTKLEFTIEDPESEFHGEKIRDNFSWTMTPNSKLFKVVKALYGQEIDEDTDLDLEDFKGKASCRITIEHVMKPNAEDPKNPRIFYRIVGASPIKKRRVAPPPPPEDDEGGDDPFE